LARASPTFGRKIYSLVPFDTIDGYEEGCALGVNLFHYSIWSGYVGIQLPMTYWPEQAQPLVEGCIPWFHLMLWICMRKNIPSWWRRQIPGWSVLGVVLLHYWIRSGYVTIQQPMMYWSEQGQPFSERYIPWFHLILLICMRKNIQSRWRWRVPGWSALAVVLFHYCLRFGYLPIQQPKMYWPELTRPLAER
jgi:hypothetical protein